MSLSWKPSPPDTVRFCEVCKKETIWGFVPAFQHSRCRVCGNNLHSGVLRVLTIDDFKNDEEKECLKKEVFRLNCLVKRHKENIKQLTRKLDICEMTKVKK